MKVRELGPNGGLIYCMEYLVDNFDWLQDELDDLGEDEYVLFDCPGQIELYSHVPAMQRVVQELQRMNFKLAAAYLLDSQFCCDAPKFISGVLCCLSAMTGAAPIIEPRGPSHARSARVAAAQRSSCRM